MALGTRIAVSPSVPRTQRNLTLYGQELSNWPMLWGEVSLALCEAEKEWFESEGDGTWKPLSPAYAARKAHLFPGKPLLRATDTLYESLTEPSEAGSLNSPNQMVFGSDDPVAEYHYKGTDRMPRRNPIIPISRQREIVRGLLEDHVRYHGYAGEA
jgi:phage gpG-like protein